MRRYMLCSAGLIVVASGAAAQSPRPAARIAAVQGLTDAELAAANRTAISRGQAPGVPMPMPQPMSGGSTVLGQPTPVTPPSVMEQRPTTAYPHNPLFHTTPAPGIPYSGPISAPAYPNAGVPMEMGAPGVELEEPLFGGCAPSSPVYGGALAGGPTTAFNKWWVYGEYIHWWTRRPTNPPLLTTSSAAFNGILGSGDTRVLYPNGDGSFLGNGHSGFRGGVGYWFGSEQRWGVEGSGFFLGRNASNFNTARPAVFESQSGNRVQRVGRRPRPGDRIRQHYRIARSLRGGRQPAPVLGQDQLCTPRSPRRLPVRADERRLEHHRTLQPHRQLGRRHRRPLRDERRRNG
jgi:hypothetical protein